MDRTPPMFASDERLHLARQLRELIAAAVAATTAEGILLSGGLDTSILGTLSASQGRRLRALTVAVAESPAPDAPFARELAARLGFEQQVLRPRYSDLLERMPEIIRILNTFDPMELRNSIVTYFALDSARAAGIGGVLTGDAADELFAGYSYMFNMPPEQLAPYIRHLNEVMHFTSVPLGQQLGVKAELPYLADAVRTFALTLGVDQLVGERAGQRFGKKILREAFADVLPEELAWRVKTPIEFGSGSTGLRQWAVINVSDAEFEAGREQAGKQDGVRLRDKEQYLYYRQYRRLFPPPREQPRGVKTCRECQGPVARPDMRFCRMCGAYPI
jgi:asparagine synthase (glutamine-hydrolysing)